MNIAGILAGGTGTRMCKSVPKQFLELCNIPIIIRVINTFLNNKNIDYTVIAMNSDWIDYSYNLFHEWNIDFNKFCIIQGGSTRFESLYNISKKAYDINSNSIVISHDCARVFVSDEIINNNFKLIKNYDCTTTSIPTIDTIIVSSDGLTSDSVPDRKTIYLDQGPQTYRAKKFLEIADSLSSEKRSEYMEIGKMYIDNNLKVGIVQGDRTNFKMTTDFDMKYGEFLILRGVVK